jgi:hypothetical protein
MFAKYQPANSAPSPTNPATLPTGLSSGTAEAQRKILGEDSQNEQLGAVRCMLGSANLNQNP